MHKNSYQIVLTQDEIDLLFVLTVNVGGHYNNSPRKHSDSVYNKIKDMLDTSSYELLGSELLIGKISFNNYSVTKTPQQLKIEELEVTINEAQKQLEELKGL